MSGAQVFVHESQFPENVRRDLLASLATRRINHKFHYESYKQAEKWLALHRAFSPANNDSTCQSAYDDAFRAADRAVSGRLVHVVGLGCGGGEKEARLLQLLATANREISYTPCDVSLPLVLTARAAVESMADLECYPLVCDLETTIDLADTVETQPVIAESRLVTLFGLVPNFDARLLLANVTPLLRRDDILLLSANLAPGTDYAAGVRAVLPQYDNVLTREWLLMFLLDLGVEQDDGRVHFNVDTDSSIKRITANFEFTRNRTVRVHGEEFCFAAGDAARLFFSARHTPDTVRDVLHQHGIEVLKRWINGAGEEGVFLCRKL